jgi:predicted RNase H-like HicB family nuclease
MPIVPDPYHHPPPPSKLPSGPRRTVLAGQPFADTEFVFEKKANGRSCSAPNLAGLRVAAGTFKETEKLLRKGIELHIIEGMHEDGLPIPEPLTRVIRMAISA